MSDQKPEKKTPFPQPELREIDPKEERIVRVAGMKFILPNQWREGDTLDAEAAIFINTAWHTACINRFGETRRELLADPRTDYNVFDAELQAFVDTYRYTPRPASAPASADQKPDDAEKALIRFARPHFNKAMRGLNLSRGRYEELLREYVRDNRETLENLYAADQASQSAVQSALSSLLGDQPDAE